MGGEHGEDTYRNNAGRSFPFLEFNQQLVEQSLSNNCIIAFDPTYIPKSGKYTPGVGFYYSGCAGREKWGLEFSGLAAIDLENKTALHLEACSLHIFSSYPCGDTLPDDLASACSPRELLIAYFQSLRKYLFPMGSPFGLSVSMPFHLSGVTKFISSSISLRISSFPGSPV